MSETLPKLLLRLSEAGDRAHISGREARPFFGKEFERLLARRVLVEQAPLDAWSACSLCECELGERPIQTHRDRLVAACPLDAKQDLILDAGDNRCFEIDAGNLVAEIARASGMDGAPEQLMPGVWRLQTDGVGDVLMVSWQGTASDPLLVSALCFALGRERGVLLLPADTPIERRHQLRQAGFDEFATADVLGPDWAINLETAGVKEAGGARLVVATNAKRAVLDGVELDLTDQLFRALLALAIAAACADPFVEIRSLENQVWHKLTMPEARQTRDVVNMLRRRLPDRSLINSKRQPTRYRFTLEPGEVQIRP